MNRRAFLVCTAALAATALPATSPAWAHHGWGGYDSTKVLTLAGTIEAAAYENPHGELKVKVAQPGAKTWTVTLAPPSRMQARGLPAGELKPGVAVTVVGYPNKTDPNEMRAERITVNGKTVELR